MPQVEEAKKAKQRTFSYFILVVQSVMLHLRGHEIWQEDNVIGA